MTEKLMYDNQGNPYLVDDGEGAPGQIQIGGPPKRGEPRMRRSGIEALKMIARRPLVGVKKIKPEEEEIVLDETVAPLRKFGYAPQAILLTNEGSLYVAPMRTVIRINGEAIVGRHDTGDIIINPALPVPPADVVFMLVNPFLSGTIERIRLFAAWTHEMTFIRNYTELTVYNQDPMPFFATAQPVPRDIIVYEDFYIRIPVPNTPTINDFRSIIDSTIDIPYDLLFDAQSSGRLGQGTGVVIPRLWFRLARWVLAGDDIAYDWRITFADGGR